ncbi:MAG: hypothetical protein EZS28_027634, partial [Streblomastix strix]
EDLKGCFGQNCMPNQVDIELVGQERGERRVKEGIGLEKQKEGEGVVCGQVQQRSQVDVFSLNYVQINREARISERIVTQSDRREDAAEPDAIVTPLGPLNALNDNNCNDNQRNDNDDNNNINNLKNQHNNNELDNNKNNNKHCNCNEDAVNKQSNNNDDTDNKQHKGNDDTNNNNDDKIEQE